MTNRRTFLVGLTGAVAAPVVAKLSLPAPADREAQWRAAEALASTAPAAASPAPIALRIDGWESPGGSESDVWVQISSSWRATWR